MKEKTAEIVFFTLICIFFSGTVFAESLYLKDGSVIEGRIVSEDDTSYVVRKEFLPQEEVRVLKADVTEIKKNSTGADLEKAPPVRKAPDTVLALSALSCLFPFWSGSFNVTCMGGPLIKESFAFMAGKTITSTVFMVGCIALFTELIPYGSNLGAGVALIMLTPVSGIVFTALMITDMIFSVKNMRYHYSSLRQTGNEKISAPVRFSINPRTLQRDPFLCREAMIYDGMDIRVYTLF